ncbi:hypothetical protein SDC9_132686 [bioreactor metagenome]|uniref:Uncharacterized protein n=1 Tax=bioreactor metagenome TaxID=1076179 RepID=A0A645D8S9_9ZZZZ
MLDPGRRVHRARPDRHHRQGQQLHGRLWPAPADDHPVAGPARSRAAEGLRPRERAHLRDEPCVPDFLHATGATGRERVFGSPGLHDGSLEEQEQRPGRHQPFRVHRRGCRPAPGVDAAAGTQGNEPARANHQPGEHEADSLREDRLLRRSRFHGSAQVGVAHAGEARPQAAVEEAA